MSELIEKLNWRYAAKRMNGEMVPKEKLDNVRTMSFLLQCS
ncbi:hypothetical protein [Dyadobacter arcticus]|uniref:Uncharacterized protein n=1 Tax=Dyadobacter arcticus TaxID=1078754 RepID=A0ABX0UJU1_9BACT|nr:hypothetical protein [Dyadobacter arcticus]NIJ53273.1 hypothetical protein [Dyadobacter arcticus]